jgi:hypothetical protein
MGVMTITYSEQGGDIDVSGKVGTQILENTVCELSITIGAKTLTGAWVEFSYVGTLITITRNDGTSFVNGIQLSPGDNIGWTAVIGGYASPNVLQNTVLGQITCTMKASEVGSIVDEKTVSKYHTGMSC